MSEHETLVDAVDRLLDRMFDELTLTTTEADVTYSAAFLEAVELARRAYLRERQARDEFHTDFPPVYGVPV